MICIKSRKCNIQCHKGRFCFSFFPFQSKGNKKIYIWVHLGSAVCLGFDPQAAGVTVIAAVGP